MGSISARRVSILGVPVDALAESELRNRIAMSDHAGLLHIATYNPEYAIAARKDAGFRAALNRADLITADGVGITVAARLHRGAPPLERLTGVALLGLLADSGRPMFLLGAGPGVAPVAAARLQAAHPNARIAGWWWEGTPDPALDDETLAKVSASGAVIVAVAYGAPGQIIWIERNRRALASIGVRIAIGVGGAIDYWAGTATPPPAIVRQLGLEWLFRLIREPWRWRRQLVLPHFGLLALGEALGTWLPRQRDRNRA